MNHTQNSMDWTHEMCLEEVGEVCADPKRRPDKMLVVLLWDEGGRYDTRFFNVGMSASEMVALLEVQKSDTVSMMRSSAEKEGER